MKPSARLPQLFALSLLLAGCSLPTPQADPVRNFTLSSPATLAPVPGATQVRPVQLAGHLHGRPMAVRISEHEIAYLDEIRWAEPLDEAITQQLRARLAAVPGGATVTVQISRCELVRYDGNRVELAAAYAISPADGGPVRRGVFNATPRQWDGKDYGVLVGQLHDAVAELGDALATAVAGP